MKAKEIELLKQQIESKEQDIFYLDMVDHWDKEDFELSEKYHKELDILRARLIKLMK